MVEIDLWLRKKMWLMMMKKNESGGGANQGDANYTDLIVN